MWTAKNITAKPVEKYLYDLLPASDPLLREMEHLAGREDIPIVGPAVGRMLHLFAQLAGAKRIFEMGSAIGYSTIWLARAAGGGAEVHYSDGDPKKAQRAESYIRRAGVAHRVLIHVGNSMDLLQDVSGNFDLIFIDVDKHQYPEAARLAMPRVRHGGLLITDNTLWSGRAARKANKNDRDTLGIQKFNRMVYAAKDFFTILVPLRDGVTVCRKI